MKQALHDIFAGQPHVGLAYQFGSRVKGETGPLSDYDFAVYFRGLDAQERFEARLMLMDKLSGVLKSDKVDLLVLNDTASPELKYAAISGELIYESRPSRLEVEPGIVLEYLDFRQSLLQHGLTLV